MRNHFLRTVAADKDPEFRNVTLLLPGNGTNGAQNNTFVDSSSNNFTVTRNGNPTQGTFSPYGPNWSNYFDGNGDYLTVPDNAAYATGTNNFTLECWIYPTQNSAGSARIISQQGPAGYWVLRQETNTIAYFYLNPSTSATVSLNSGAVITPNLWYHLAVVRNGNSFTLYVNGVSVATGTSSGAIPDIARVVAIGAYFETTASEFFTGNISNIRLVSGSAVYTSAFIPPATPLTAITGTVLLTCQSNRLIDNSANNFAITRNGDVSVQKFSPFNPTAAYDSAVVGGSGYFDGTGDFLDRSFSSTTDGMYPQGTTYTIEAWVYVTTTASVQYVYSCTAASGANFAELNLRFSTNLEFSVRPSNGGTVTTISGGTIIINAWNHFAISVSAGSGRLFLNGSQVGSTTTIPAMTFTPVGASVGRIANGSIAAVLAGYVADVRLVKGTSLYTANFTPPTAPLTAITNTSLLLNFTNAGVIDNSMMNDLETIGGTQISTARSIFGGSSIYCDSSGDYLFVPGKNEIEFGAGDFTLECWINWTAAPSATREHRIWYPANHASGSTRLIVYAFQNYLVVGWFGTNLLGPLYTWNANQWYHIAVTRSGNTWRIFRDGVLGQTVTNSTTLAAASGYRIGDQCDAYFDDYRITKGVARYTANFTPPVRSLPTR